jgi:hypothetical protein
MTGKEYSFLKGKKVYVVYRHVTGFVPFGDNCTQVYYVAGAPFTIAVPYEVFKADYEAVRAQLTSKTVIIDKIGYHVPDAVFEYVKQCLSMRGKSKS